MRRALIPLLAFVGLCLVMLAHSDAQLGVQAHFCSALAVGMLVPSLLAARMQSKASRWSICIACALIAIAGWDATAHLNIAKFEAFSIWRNAPWIYALLGGAMAVFSWTIAKLTEHRQEVSHADLPRM